MAATTSVPRPGELGANYAWPAHFDDDDGNDAPSSRGKRSRVALACQRCKTRKQKCDGTQPCAKCTTNNQRCEYVIPQKPMPFGQKHYIKALERRIAELETILATHGMAELSSDHWRVTTDTTTAPTAATSVTDSTRTDTSDDDVEDAVLDWQDGVDSVAAVLRSLSLDVNGSGYVGASSHIAFGRLFSFIRGREKRHSATPRHDGTPDAFRNDSALEETIELEEVPDNVADRLFDGYLKHIATRWPVVYSVWAREIHKRRFDLTDQFEETILHLIYATAGRFVETTGEFGSFHAKRHYASAVQQLDVILGFNDVRSVQVLMLMAVYCLRDPAGAGAWICSRTALLIAIDHGMHRQTKALSNLSMTSQLRKRLFWACYSFDRQISIPMGRPFGISDRDIDIELPLDISENTTEAQLESLDSVLGSPAKSTSLTSFLMIVQLRHIESDIQQTIYRVDKSNAIDDSVVDDFLSRLRVWKSKIPRDTQRLKDVGNVPFDGTDYYVRSSSDIYSSLHLLTYTAGVLLQVSTALALSSDFENRHCTKISESMRSGLCGCLRRLQTPSSGFGSRILAHGTADRFHGRSDPRILLMDLARGHICVDYQQRHPRLQHCPFCNCGARPCSQEVPQCL